MLEKKRDAREKEREREMLENLFPLWGKILN